VQEHDQNDEWDRYSEKPKQNGHVGISLYYVDDR
jgi:hypothetical protein